MRATGKDLAEAYALLAASIERGTPPESGLALLADWVRSPRHREFFTSAAAALREGCTLPEALGRASGLFPAEDIAWIRSAPGGAGQAEVLRALELRHRLKDRFRSRMCRVGFYVGTGAVLVEILLILLAALASVHALQARDLYEAWGGRDLPGIVEWTGNLWPLTLLPPAVLLAVAGIFAWVRRWKRLSWVEYALPLWGRIRKASDLTTFCSVVALAIGARRPILEALEAARDAIGNPRFKGAVADLLRRVGEGEATATAFHHETFFPRMLSWSCHLGETRGDLGGVFAELSRTYSSQMERGFGMLTDLLTPVSLILVGNLVLISALITLGPYFGMFLISSTLGNY